MLLLLLPRFLKTSINRLLALKCIHFMDFARCAFDETPEPRIGKVYRLMCSGLWLMPAASKCKCCADPVVHLPLMLKTVDANGKTHSTGIKERMVESGRYPMSMGNFQCISTCLHIVAAIQHLVSYWTCPKLVSPDH